MREFVVEADGGSRGNPGPAGYGAVVLDAATGETLAEAAEYLGVVTNNVAEYRGLLAGLRAAKELDPDAAVHVRMDSKLVVEQMSGRWKIKHPDMKPLAAEAARVFPPGRVTYEWIPRASNKHADRLANEAMDAGARGERWSPSLSTAELDAGDARAAADAGADAEPGAEPGAERGAPGSGDGAAVGERIAQSARTAPETAVVPRPSADAAADADVRAAKTVASPGWGPPDMGAPATFVLLRHGETPLTPQKRFSGSGGDLLGLEVTVEEGLRETDFGAWEGLTFAEARERYPDDLDAWLSSPDAEPTGGGESFAATGARVAATRDRLAAAYAGRTVLLVSHVTPIKTFVRLALGAPPESLFRMELSAASLSAVAYYADGGASVRLFNDTSHLR
ncbi:histidine phosphatase family protein [Streptomyces sp. E2N166]|uniref:histidine phosphatase family protein n=1 Tax=Streptomyces sp. E2N166 TaxID=1851909 RepID=UPI00187D4439|nr:histidine phosphatase family protein [Streptomyces sp. E2N166]